MAPGISDCEESSEYKESGEELSNWQESTIFSLDYCKSVSLSFFLIQVLLVSALSFTPVYI